MDAVRIFPDKRQKFVLVRLATQGSASGEFALWSNPDIEWHNDIVQEMTTVGHKVSEVLGGGWLYFDPDAKELYIWGKSDRFGRAPFEQAGELVIDEIPGITIHIDREPNC